MGSRGRFVYDDLSEARNIRLFKLDAETCEGEISGTLVQASLDSASTRYLALSYVWGDPDDTVPIRCNGHTLEITRNLHLFLQQLRKKGRSDDRVRGSNRYLWADAICINQSNDQERTRQVRLMRDIYSKAVRVVARLGEETGADQRGFEFIEHFFQAIQKHFKSLDEFLGFHSSDLESIGLPNLGDSIWDDCCRVLQKPWFTRVWIIQESLMAKALFFLCGERLIAMESLFYFAHVLRTSGLFFLWVTSRDLDPAQMNAQSLCRLRDSFEAGKLVCIEALLVAANGFQASDARDKVYALVGLSSDLDSDFVDYAEGLTSSLLFRLSVHLLNIQENRSSNVSHLYTLSYAQALPRPQGDPSWVTNWALTRFCMTPLTSEFPDEELIMPQANCCPEFASIKDHSLILHGKLFDHINVLVEQPQVFEIPSLLQSFQKLLRMGTGLDDLKASLCKLAKEMHHVLEYVSSLEQLVAELQPYPTNEKIADVCWRSMMLDDECLENANYCGTVERHLKLVQFAEKLSNSTDRLKNPDERDTISFLGIPCGCYVSFTLATWSSYRFVDGWFHRLWVAMLLWTLIGFILYELVKVLNRLTNHFTWKSFERNVVEIEAISKELRRFNEAWVKASHGRSYCSTRNGYVGWMPAKAQKGDEIWFFDGTRLPFVLRPLDGEHKEATGEQNEPLYKLIGDCYVHGLMRPEKSAALPGSYRHVTIS